MRSFCHLKNTSLLRSPPFASPLESHPISLALTKAPLSMTGKELAAGALSCGCDLVENAKFSAPKIQGA